jgi:translation initiation factor eIF-2B subunit gamma
MYSISSFSNQKDNLHFLILSTERDLVGLDTETSRLVFLASISDFDDTVSMPRRLLQKHPHISMFSQLIDAHFYVIRKWVVDYLAYEK